MASSRRSGAGWQKEQRWRRRYVWRRRPSKANLKDDTSPNNRKKAMFDPRFETAAAWLNGQMPIVAAASRTMPQAVHRQWQLEHVIAAKRPDLAAREGPSTAMYVASCASLSWHLRHSRRS